MSTVDDRIVSMKFDNAAFEQKIGNTLKSLDKLKQSLDFANSTRGMNELSAASKNVNLAPMANGVDGISAKFLALTTVAVTALATIVSHAVSSGLRMTNALSFGPIKEGFREYETNMNSIQTILANTDSKGTTLKDVSKALDQLNTYSDQTIYNFSEMARNIGTFTAAGVDLDKSVMSIKGIANLAAISGSNSEQASTAMYQLSQAMASGTVKLMDWNSVVNAGMGGEVFQKALFEAGKAAKTLKGVPLSQTFEQWKKAGNSFRGSLEEGWLTGEVLTKTLAGFTGDLTEAQIMSMGYTKAQAAEVMRLGKIGKAAATEVKTMTQLFSTVKESIASGWSSTFRLIVGDFEEAKKLFTSISNSVGKVIGDGADARNEMLKGWKELGGRDILIQGFKNALAALGSVLIPIKEAFREIFPPMTAKRLRELTITFAIFMRELKVSETVTANIKRTFAGLFAAIEIGWTIFKGLIGLIGDILSNFKGAGNGVLGFTGNIGDMLVHLNKVLVTGGGIKAFFDQLGYWVRDPAHAFDELKETITDFLKGIPAFAGFFKGAETVVERFGDRVDSIKGVPDRFFAGWDRVAKVFEGVRKVLDEVGEYIKDWMASLGDKLAEAIQPGDFNAAVDVVNVGLLGGIALMLKRFISGGFKNFGGGIVQKINDAFDGLTGSLKAMQANVKADTLMKIAIAVGILAVSIVALSLINSADLTKAMVAMTIGFGQMIGVMTLLENVTTGPMGAAKIVILTGGLLLLAGAMVILSVAVKNLSSLSWNEVAKGLVGVGIGLGLMVAAMRFLPPSPGMIASGIAMTAISVALLLLSKAVKSFSDMSWAEMSKGLVGVAGGLVVVAGAMWLMPPGMIAVGLGLIAVSAGLLILAKAVEAFSDIPWGDMGKGLLGIGAALVIIAGAMWLMPPGMIVTASGLLILSVALNIMAQAVQSMGEMKLGEIAKGLGALALMLGILSVAMIAMTGTAAGAAALIVTAAALVILAGVLKTLGGMSISQIVTGLAALAGVFIVLGVAALLLTPVVPALMSLGIALTLIGGAMTLFGIGAMLVAKAFETIARAGKTGVSVLIEMIKMFIAALPEFVGALVKSIVELASEILAAGPLLLRLITAILLQILETVITLVPKIGEALGAIISTGIKIIRENYPQMIVAGFELLMALLRGVRDNIGEITTLGVDIVVNFALALLNNVIRIVDAGVALLKAFLAAISDRIGEVVAAGLNILVNLILGISANMFRILDIVSSIATNFITELGRNASRFITAGADALISFVSGIINNIIKVSNAAAELVVKFISGIDDNALKIINAAADMVIDFLNGLATVIREKAPELRAAGSNITGAIIEGMLGGLKNTPVIGEAIKMAQGVIGAVKGVFDSKSPSKVFMRIGKDVVKGLALGLDNDNTATYSAIKQGQSVVKAFQDSLNKVPDSLAGLGEFNPVITPVLDLTKVQRASKNLNDLMSMSTITPEVSYQRARLISTTADLESRTPAAPVYTGPAEVSFEQNIFAPTALSTNDIYRNTKSQIVLAKEELGIS